jgi:phosphate-selective porin OprO and OprP
VHRSKFDFRFRFSIYILLFGAPAWSQEPAPAPIAEQRAPEPRAAGQPEQSKPFKGFSIQSEDGDYQLKVGGFIQADARVFTESAGDPINTFAVRRARIDLRATVGRYFELRVQPEFAGSSPRLLDAYANLRFFDEVQFQAGKMKSPIGLEYLRAPTDLVFPEFGLPTSLVPQRDVGFYVHGNVLDSAVGYQLGVFNGVTDGADGDVDDNDAKELEGRIFVHPFGPLQIESLAGLGVGIAGTYGEQDCRAFARRGARRTSPTSTPIRARRRRAASAGARLHRLITTTDRSGFSPSTSTRDRT